MNHRIKKKRFRQNQCPLCVSSDTCGQWNLDSKPYKIVSVFCYKCGKFWFLENGKLNFEQGEKDEV